MVQLESSCYRQNCSFVLVGPRRNVIFGPSQCHPWLLGNPTDPLSLLAKCGLRLPTSNKITMRHSTHSTFLSRYFILLPIATSITTMRKRSLNVILWFIVDSLQSILLRRVSTGNEYFIAKIISIYFTVKRNYYKTNGNISLVRSSLEL